MKKKKNNDHDLAGLMNWTTTDRLTYFIKKLRTQLRNRMTKKAVEGTEQNAKRQSPAKKGVKRTRYIILTYTSVSVTSVVPDTKSKFTYRAKFIYLSDYLKITFTPVYLQPYFSDSVCKLIFLYLLTSIFIKESYWKVIKKSPKMKNMLCNQLLHSHWQLESVLWTSIAGQKNILKK